MKLLLWGLFKIVKSTFVDWIESCVPRFGNVAGTLQFRQQFTVCTGRGCTESFVTGREQNCTSALRDFPSVWATVLFSVFLFICLNAQCWAGTTYAWTNFVGQSGGPGNADGLARYARFNYPQDIVADGLGNFYVADSANHIIRKLAIVGAEFVVTTVAGTAGVSGTNDGVASEALFNSPSSLAVDSSGAIYVADSENHTIRKLSLAGTNLVVTTIAGAPGVYGTNDGPGNEARFNLPSGLAIDSSGNIYVADAYNSAIRKITPLGTNWVVTTLAGLSGEFGTNDGVGNTARFRAPTDLTLDDAGNIYVADTYNHAIRKVTQTGVVTTLAGLPGDNGTNDGTGLTARFACPGGIAFNSSGYLLVADGWNHTIRRVSMAGEVTTIAGLAGRFGYADGSSNMARFFFPAGLCIGGTGFALLADAWNHAIRKLSVTETGCDVTTITGVPEASGTNDGVGSFARFNLPHGLALTAGGSLLVADQWNHTIRLVTPTGNVVTIAGLPLTLGTNDGLGSAARFYRPIGVAVAADDTVYITDWFNHTVRKAVISGQYLAVTTFAGQPGIPGTNDGTAATARFLHPRGVATDGLGNVFIADEWNHAIRKITADGTVTTLAGTIGVPGTNDGPVALAQFNRPCAVVVDAAHNIFVADAGNHTIRKITTTGSVITFAGMPGIAGTNDGTGLQARFNGPTAITLDSSGNLFVADTGNCTVRKVTQDGTVTTIGGLPGVKGGVNGIGTNGLFVSPAGLAVDAAGNVYVADAGNNCIVKGTPISVEPSLVVLSCACYGTNIVLWWPTNAVGFELEYTTNLPAINWVPIATTPVIVGNRFIVTNAITDLSRFYRLRKP